MQNSFHFQLLYFVCHQICGYLRAANCSSATSLSNPNIRETHRRGIIKCSVLHYSKMACLLLPAACASQAIGPKTVFSCSWGKLYTASFYLAAPQFWSQIFSPMMIRRQRKKNVYLRFFWSPLLVETAQKNLGSYDWMASYNYSQLKKLLQKTPAASCGRNCSSSNW